MAARVFMAVESLAAGSGGIARVARLVAKVLTGEADAARLKADGVVFSDRSGRRGGTVPVRAASGSRLRYAARVQAAALTHTHFVYDFLGMARAHCRLPGLRRPFLAWCYGIDVWEEARRDRLRCAARADMLVTCSAHTRERAHGLHGGFKRARVCWLGTETDAPPAGAPAADGPPTALVVGRLEPGRDKGHRALIDCWPEVLRACPDAVLRIAGTGADEADLRRRAGASRAGRSIRFEGRVSEEALQALYRDAAVFAMPSRGEGFGLVYIEAMRHGLPVVASVHDAASEVVLDGRTGCTVDLEREGQLADTLIAILRDPQLARRLGAAGRTRWAEHFTYSAFRERFVSLLEEFLGV